MQTPTAYELREIAVEQVKCALRAIKRQMATQEREIREARSSLRMAESHQRSMQETAEGLTAALVAMCGQPGATSILDDIDEETAHE